MFNHLVNGYHLNVSQMIADPLNQLLCSMGDLQDPKMEVRQYHISGHIFWGYSLKFRPYIWQVPPIEVPEMAIDKMALRCLGIATGHITFGSPFGGLHQFQTTKRPGQMITVYYVEDTSPFMIEIPSSIPNSS